MSNITQKSFLRLTPDLALTKVMEQHIFEVLYNKEGTTEKVFKFHTPFSTLSRTNTYNLAFSMT
jgi:hypothetical protein